MRRGTRGRRCGPGAALGLLMLVLATLAARPASAAEPSELEALRGAIEKARERVGRYERDERGLLDLLDEIDLDLERLAAETQRARREVAQAQQAVAEVEPRLGRIEAQLAATRAAMARRAVALYKASEVGPVRVLFSAASLPDLLSGLSSLQRLLAHDAQLVGRFRSEQTSLRATQSEALAARSRFEQALATLADRSRELEAERSVKGELLASARGDRTRERGLLVELERAAAALEETLARLGDVRPETAAPVDGMHFERSRGSLPAPVAGEIRQGFGRVVDAEYRTETFRKGVEFAAARGESVRAVATGQVRFAGWFRGYGKIVIVDHGGGYFTVSGHLDEVFVGVGDAVTGEDTLGTVGETGSLSGPGLYFEIRRAGEPLDPLEWLQRHAAG